jgi:hypothetical protein
MIIAGTFEPWLASPLEPQADKEPSAKIAATAKITFFIFPLSTVKSRVETISTPVFDFR